ncbi:MAG TPA: hypothetical protein VIY72_07815 [Acidimicrobiales bacterium]
MPPSPPVVVNSPRRFPATVEAELDRRRADLRADLGGDVLDLDRPEARAEVARAAAGRPVERTYGVALSVGQLVRFPDLVAALRGIDRLVGPDGRLLLVEPTGRPGLVSLALQSIWARTPRTRGFHLGRDVTAAVRATTFTLDDIERFTMSTAVTSLRHAVEVHAVRSAAAVVAPEPRREVTV